MLSTYYTLDEFINEPDPGWEALVAFLEEPSGEDAAAPSEWAANYVDELFEEYDWGASYSGETPGRDQAADDFEALTVEAVEYLSKEIAKLDPVDEGDYAITSHRDTRGEGLIIRSVLWDWLSGQPPWDATCGHCGGHPVHGGACPQQTFSVANRRTGAASGWASCRCPARQPSSEVKQ